MDSIEMDEYYQYAVQRLRLLQEFISELQAVWDDAAAQAIQMKVLEPHKVDSEQMLKAFRDQCETFDRIQQKLQSIEMEKLDLQEHNELIIKEQNYAQKEIYDARYMHNQFLEYDSMVQSQLPEVYRYIQSAKEYI